MTHTVATTAYTGSRTSFAELAARAGGPWINPSLIFPIPKSRHCVGACLADGG